MNRAPYRLKRKHGVDYFVLDFGPDKGASIYMTTRRGGVSYSKGDLNLSFGVNDDFDSVLENRNRAARALGSVMENTANVVQHHSTDVVVATEENWQEMVKSDFRADGMVTDLLDHWMGISIGDCLALAIYDPVKCVLSLIHAGWEGTAKRIVEDAVSKMEVEFGCRPHDFWVVLSPCIRFHKFQVDEPVFNEFGKHWHGWDQHVHDRVGNSGYLDLIGANIWLLKYKGIPESQILDFGLCTYTLSSLMFSHRRDKTQDGRMFIVAGMKSPL